MLDFVVDVTQHGGKFRKAHFSNVSSAVVVSNLNRIAFYHYHSFTSSQKCDLFLHLVQMLNAELLTINNVIPQLYIPTDSV